MNWYSNHFALTYNDNIRFPLKALKALDPNRKIDKGKTKGKIKKENRKDKKKKKKD